MYLCICVQCGWYRWWHFDDSWDGTHLQPPVKLYSSEHSEFHCNEDDAKNANNDDIVVSIKNIIFYHPGFPHPVIFSLQWPYTRKSRFQFAPILQTFAGFFMFWGSGSLEVGKSKKSEKRRKLSGVIFQTRSSQTLIFFHILNIFYSWQLLLCFKGWLHWCYFLLFSLRHYLANQFPKITRYLLKGLIQQHDPRTLSLSLSSSLSSSLSWFSTRIPGLCLCPNRFQESGNILRSQILQKNFFF